MELLLAGAIKNNQYDLCTTTKFCRVYHCILARQEVDYTLPKGKIVLLIARNVLIITNPCL